MNSLTQTAYSFFQLVPDGASAGEGPLSVVAHGQGRAGVGEAFIHICRGQNTGHTDAASDSKTITQHSKCGPRAQLCEVSWGPRDQWDTPFIPKGLPAY